MLCSGVISTLVWVLCSYCSPIIASGVGWLRGSGLESGYGIFNRINRLGDRAIDDIHNKAVEEQRCGRWPAWSGLIDGVTDGSGEKCAEGSGDEQVVFGGVVLGSCLRGSWV